MIRLEENTYLQDDLILVLLRSKVVASMNSFREVFLDPAVFCCRDLETVLDVLELHVGRDGHDVS